MSGHRWVVEEYTSNHAIRKGDIAKAFGVAGKLQRRRTGVAGRGCYKQWTPQMMLRSAFHVSICQFLMEITALSNIRIHESYHVKYPTISTLFFWSKLQTESQKMNVMLQALSDSTLFGVCFLVAMAMQKDS